MNKKFLVLGAKSKLLVTAFVVAAIILNAPAAPWGSNKCNAAIAFQNSLEVTSRIALSNYSYCVALNDETNRVYVGVRGALVVINGETNEIIKEIQLDQYKLGFVSAVAVNTQTNRIYVTAGFLGDRIAVIDGDTNLEVAAINETVTDQSELAINSVTNRIYVSDNAWFLGDYDKIHVYDGENFAQIATVNIPGSNSHLYLEKVGVAANPNTNKVYATWSGEDTVYLIDGNTNSISRTTKATLAEDEARIMVNPYTNYVYVAHSTPLEGETLERVANTSTLGVPRAIDPVRNCLYIIDSNTLYRLNGTTHGVIDSLYLPWDASSGDSFAVNPTTSKIYAAASDQLYVISVQTPSLSPQSTLTPSPSVPEFPTCTILPFVLIAVLVMLIIAKLKK